MDYSANLWISLIGYPGLYQTFVSLSGSHAITSESEDSGQEDKEQRERTFLRIFLTSKLGFNPARNSVTGYNNDNNIIMIIGINSSDKQ